MLETHRQIIDRMTQRYRADLDVLALIVIGTHTGTPTWTPSRSSPRRRMRAIRRRVARPERGGAFGRRSQQHQRRNPRQSVPANCSRAWPRADPVRLHPHHRSLLARPGDRATARGDPGVSRARARGEDGELRQPTAGPPRLPPPGRLQRGPVPAHRHRPRAGAVRRTAAPRPQPAPLPGPQAVPAPAGAAPQKPDRFMCGCCGSRSGSPASRRRRRSARQCWVSSRGHNLRRGTVRGISAIATWRRCTAHLRWVRARVEGSSEWHSRAHH